MLRIRSLALRLTLACALLAVWGPSAEPIHAQPGAPVATGPALLVGLRSGTRLSAGSRGFTASDSALASSLNQLSVQSAASVFSAVAGSGQVRLAGLASPVDLRAIYRLHLSPGADVAAAMSALRNNPAVVYVEPDAAAHLITTPNDPLLPQQWGLAQIGAPAAWSVVTGSASVAIAIIDSGLDTTHPDLAGQLWTNPGEIAGNSLDDDNDGHVDDIHGWNLLNNNADLSDNNGHGTEVAGIAAAATNNGQGVAGVCWTCKLMVVKVAQPSGVANYSDIAAGVAYAAQKGAKVINLSLGGNSDSITLRAAIESAAATAVIVGGAGNDDSSALFYPAAYDDVLAVAGTTITDTKVADSNFGSWVDVTAPGEAITTTFDAGGFGAVSGTSLAAPFASGLAGLLFAQHPSWSPAQVRAQIVHTAHNIDAGNPGYAGQLGSGRIDAASTVSTAAAPLVSLQSYTVNGQVSGTPSPNSQADVAITLFNDWGPATNLQATLSGGGAHASVVSGTVSYGTLDTYESQTNSGTLRINVASAGFGAALPFTVHLTANGGFSADLPLTITTQSAVQHITGVISSPTIWTADKVYQIDGDVLVNSGTSLTIQPGTVVKFNGYHDLEVGGELVAIGTADQPIRFTSNAASPQPGDWKAIVFRNSSTDAAFDVTGVYSSGSTLQYVDMEYGGTLMAYASSPYIAHSHIAFNNAVTAGTLPFFPYDASTVTLHNSATRLEYSTIEYNQGGAVQSDGASATVLAHDLVRNNQTGKYGTGISVLGGECLIVSSDILNNGAGQYGGGLYLSSNSAVVISDTLVAGNAGGSGGSGIAVDVAPFTITNSTIVDNLGFAAVQVYISHPGDTLSNSNLVGNHRAQNPYYALYLDSPSASADVSAPNNYWGATDPNQVNAGIHDFYDDFNVGTVFTLPIATAPITTAPPFLVDASVNPDPAGIQTATFRLTYSRPMDQSINPLVTFGVTAPYTRYAVLNNAQWLSPTVWSGTFDITSLVPKGDYTLSVSGAQAEGGRITGDDTRFGFTVDYAGQITDQSAPSQPFVLADGAVGNASLVTAHWQATDPNSPIIHYRYALGSAPGAVDILNWTPLDATSVTRSGLGLVSGHHYWFSIQAQNQGGLWSPVASSRFTAGAKNPSMFLPVLSR